MEENIKTPPHSAEAERGVLGSILLDAETGDDVRVLDICQSQGITPEAFFEPRHRLLYETLTAMSAAGLPIELSPAWLVSQEDQNPYNIRTREIIREFEPLNIPLGSGNVVFPSGNALKYLHEYFDENVSPSSPYEEDPRDIRSLSFSPDGDVLNGNIYKTDILEIIRTYRP